jgi:hypothetical protein
MLKRDTSNLIEIPATSMAGLLERLKPATWQVMACVSLLAGIGSGWRILVQESELLSPLLVSTVTVLVIFAGWYAWSFFIYLTDSVLFGRRSSFHELLSAFAWAYVAQIFFFLVFTRPLGWLWGWVALYATITAWGIVGPTRLGTRTWQAVLSATIGMFVWLAGLLALTLMVSWQGVHFGFGVFLV